MTIKQDDVISLMNEFHDVTMVRKGTAAEQAAFFLRPEEARVIVPHGEDISMQANYEIHQRLTDERHAVLDPLDLTPLSDEPDRARVVGAVYWEGRVRHSPDAVIKAIVGEDWIVERGRTGALKIVLYVNSFHYFLPDSARVDLSGGGG